MKRGWFLISIVSFLLFFAFFSINCASSLIINEVMPNPYDNCKDCTEWFEFYSENEPMNLTNWTINTGESNKTVNAFIQDYMVITKNKTAFLSFWNVSAEKVLELDIGLTNSEDTIQVYNSTDGLVDSFSWTNDIGNKSWSILDNGTFIPCSDLSPTTHNLCSMQQNNESNQTNETNPSTEDNDPDSDIDIKDSPDKAKFGSTIEVKAKIYRGDTGKYAVYAYVQDKNEDKVSEKITTHVKTRFRQYTKTFQIELDCLNKSGDYEIIVEGLGEKDSEKIYLESCYEIKSPIPQTQETQIEENQETSVQRALMPSRVYSSDQITSYATNIFETSSFSFLKILFYVLSGLILVLIIVLIVKRKN